MPKRGDEEGTKRERPERDVGKILIALFIDEYNIYKSQGGTVSACLI